MPLELFSRKCLQCSCHMGPHLHQLAPLWDVLAIKVLWLVWVKRIPMLGNFFWLIANNLSLTI